MVEHSDFLSGKSIIIYINHSDNTISNAIINKVKQFVFPFLRNRFELKTISLILGKIAGMDLKHLHYR